MEFKIPFAGVGALYSEDEKKVVMDAMNARTTLTQGPEQQKFESKFREFLGMPHCFATSSAAGALELTAMLLNFSEGDEVVCPAHTYAASAYPFAKHGAQLVWSDINPNTWVVDVEALERVVTSRTRLIIVVHLYGNVADMDAIMKFARARGILVLEDCAQAIGAERFGDRAGSFGDFAVFSFQSHKNISTLGEGGMLCVKAERHAKLVPGLRHNGHRPYEREDPSLYWVPAMVNLEVDVNGVWPVNFCLGEVQCALGSKMLERVESINDRRRLRFHQFAEATNELSTLKLQSIESGVKSACHLLPIKFTSELHSRDELIKRLAFQYGIQAIVQYYPCNRYPLFARNGFGVADIPHTDQFFDNMISLPFHQWMSDSDFAYMIDSVRDCFEECP